MIGSRTETKWRGLMSAIGLMLAACSGGGGGDGGEDADTENTSAACHDGIDNDGDGATDCADPECTDFVFCAADADADGDGDVDGGGDADTDVPDPLDVPDGDDGFPEADDGGDDAETGTCGPDPGDGCGPVEMCDDGRDNDCDGEVDEPEAGCTCAHGTFQPCYGGPPGRAGVGGCVTGWQLCDPATGTWGRCEGWIAPAEDVCNGKDDDCDGCPDEGSGCDPGGFACPDEVLTRPIGWHPLRCYDYYAGRGTCEWSVQPATGSRKGRPEDPRAGYTRFYMDVAGDYVVHVDVSDEWGMRQDCRFVVRARPSGIHAHLWWDNYVVGGEGRSNMDLHFHRDPPRTDYFRPDDCWRNNCGGIGGYYEIHWGYPDVPIADCGVFLDHSRWELSIRGSCPNPRMEQDGEDGTYEVETVSLDNANAGDRFRLMVHYYEWIGWSSGDFPTTASLRIWCDGRPAMQLGPAPLRFPTPARPGEVWRVADLEAGGAGRPCTITPLVPLPGYDIRTYTVPLPF